MLSRISFVFLIGCLLFLPLHVAAMEKDGFSPDVATFMETDGMKVYGDPEIKAIQGKITEYSKKKNLTAKEREEAAALIDRLLSSIQQISKEYMSGKRVAVNPEHTVQDPKELRSCVDDGSCSSNSNKQTERSSQLVQQVQSEYPAELPQQSKQKKPEHPAEQRQQSQQPTTEKKISFGELLNRNPTGTLEEIREKLKL